MSRRTAPIFSDSSSRWNTFSSSRRHTHGHSVLPIRLDTLPSKPTPQTAAQTLFDALDQGRFDQVRRAITANPQVIHATSVPRTALATTTTPSPSRLNVIDYALNNCRTWMALMEHCHRTGIGVPQLGYLTFRERLAAMNLIISWLLVQSGVPCPTETPLHIAISSKFDAVCDALINRDSGLVRSVDARRKTPLHVCASLPGRMQVGFAKRYIRALVDEGADVNAQDVEGRTPLHELVYSLSVSTPVYGLVRSRRQTRSLGSIHEVVDCLLMCGADIYVKDSKGECVLDAALVRGLDYVELALRANWMFERICGGGFKAEVKGRVGGIWGMLPEEVVMKIVRYLSPRDAVCGLGATCVGLRRVVLSKQVWRRYSIDYSMAAVKDAVRWRGKSLGRREGGNGNSSYGAQC